MRVASAGVAEGVGKAAISLDRADYFVCVWWGR